LILWFDTPVGSMAVVLVGALNVASLATPWLGEIPSGRPLLWDQNAIAAGSLECGVEIGRFNLGSTVITALPPGSTRWNTEIAPGTYVRMGQALGSITRHTEPD
jgi:phosphatidylserine decarboxylase